MSDAPDKTNASPARIETVGPERVRVFRDDFDVLHLVVDGETHADVRPLRLFPVSGKVDYVSFVTRERKEVCLLSNPDGLDEASRKALEDALESMYYMPKIRRIDSIREIWGISHWETQTDCGYATFEVVNREQIRRLPNGRFIIQDADGNRFEIEDINTLDPRSRMLVHSET